MHGLRWVLHGRVSSSSQADNTSTEKQLEKLKEEVERTDGEIVKTYDLTESAASMDRDSLEETAELAEEDKFDVLGVWKLDRLTRASPWETIRYLDRLRKAGVILYAHTHGYFEWDDLYDFEMLARRVVFAREWYQRIIENGREGQVKDLEAGRWPFGNPPYGYETNDDKEIRLTEKGEEVIRGIVELYLDYEDMGDVEEEISDRYDDNVSVAQINNILQNPIIVGNLTLKDTVVAREEKLRVIDDETFKEVQEIQEENSSSPSNTRDIPEQIDRAVNRFGVQFVLSILDSVGVQCRKCGSDLKPNGTTQRRGTTVRKYKCTSEECGYEGPLLKQTEFEEIHQTLPLRCPYCPGTERFTVERRDGGFWKYLYKCENCGKSLGSDVSPSKIKRAMENPRFAFKWGGKTDPPQEDDDDTTDESDIDDDEQDDGDDGDGDESNQSQETFDDY
jgi:DNA invertase Pin-like site-specific DNA recombinase/DNA-directed RNA polymerase subunit RPC12/RpoP